jgi:hypothetical protein
LSGEQDILQIGGGLIIQSCIQGFQMVFGLAVKENRIPVHFKEYGLRALPLLGYSTRLLIKQVEQSIRIREILDEELGNIVVSA